MFQDKKVIALIPARGGSKGIPRKNIKKLGKKPLIAYTIFEANQSKYIDRVIVSTDDEEIAKIAREYNAEIPFLRPSKYSQDTSSSLSVIIHTLKFLKERENYIPDIIVFLQPTSPFRSVKYIDEGIEKIINCDCVVGVTEVSQHPFFMFERIHEDILKPYLDIEDRPLRRQDVPILYVVNASMIIAKNSYYQDIKKNDPVGPLFKGKVRGVFMEGISSLDINNDFDFGLANFILSKKFRNENN